MHYLMGSSDDKKSQVYQRNFADVIVRHIHLDNKGLFHLVIFCSLLILIITLVFYSHCVYRRHHGVRNTSNAVTISPAARSVGVDPTIINSMPTILQHSRVTGTGTGTGTVAATGTVYTESECCICLGRFEDGEKLKVLEECQHAYHSDCLDKWLANHSSCPLCRTSLQANSRDESVNIP